MPEPRVICRARFGRREVALVHHCYERWVQGGRDGSRMSAAFEGGEFVREQPPGIILSLYLRARARGYIACAEGAFVVTDDTDGRLYAVTFIGAERYRYAG